MTGVHIIALISALVTLSLIVELSRRRHLHEKYAVMWLAVAVVIAVFAIFPGLFNSIAHGVGVKNPPDLLGVMADLFLLTVCVRFSWEIGRLEDRSAPWPRRWRSCARTWTTEPANARSQPGHRATAPGRRGRPDGQCQTCPAWHCNGTSPSGTASAPLPSPWSWRTTSATSPAAGWESTRSSSCPGT